MKAQVEELREVVSGLSSRAEKGLKERKGGNKGVGEVMRKEVQELYVRGGMRGINMRFYRMRVCRFS